MNTENKHTDGQWFVEGDYVYSEKADFIHDRRGIRNPPQMTVYVDCLKSVGPDVRQANCQLISAAPDLLDALEALNMAYNQGRMPTLEERQMCCAALSKAKGQS